MAKKEFKAGLYGVVATVLVAVVLVGLTVFAFTSRYNAFSPEKVAQSYADTIVPVSYTHLTLPTTERV